MTSWRNTYRLGARRYVCAYCDTSVSSRTGFWNDYWNCRIYICASCDQPTYFGPDGSQFPAPLFGERLQHLPEDVRREYQEIRSCISASAYSAAYLLSRRLLMHLAIAFGAPEGRTFGAYLDHLLSTAHLSENSRRRLERLRSLDVGVGLDTEPVNRDAIDLFWFLEILLRFLYEFPGKISGRCDP